MNSSPKQAAIWGAIAGALLLPLLQTAATYASWQVSMALTKSTLPSSLLSVMRPWAILVRAAPFEVPIGAALGALTGVALSARAGRDEAALRVVSRWACGVLGLHVALILWAAWSMFRQISAFSSSTRSSTMLAVASTLVQGIVTNVGFFWALALALTATIAANRFRHEEKRAQQFAAPVEDGLGF